MVYQHPHIFYKIRRGKTVGELLRAVFSRGEKKTMRCCGTVCRNGTICMKPVGHVGECEIFQGKRKRPQEVVDAIARMKERTKFVTDSVTFRPAKVHIGCDHQAVVPDWNYTSDKTRPAETYTRADALIDSATAEDCVSQHLLSDSATVPVLYGDDGIC